MVSREQLIERQRVLAKFSEFALRGSELQDVLEEACRLVGDALGTDLAKVLEIQPDGRSILVRAGCGWRPGIVGETTLQMEEKSSETYAIKVAEPVVTPDIHKEERFVLPPFLVDHGVKAIVNVPIFVSRDERAYGLLQVDSTSPRDFGEEDIEFLRIYAGVLGPVIDRLHKRHDLAVALDANKRLLVELQHRIKNNIGMITSLVHMRARGAKSDDARAELEIVGDRIETLRLAHEHVYAEGSSTLSLRSYASKILQHLIDLHGDHAGAIKLTIHVDDIKLGPDRAVPLGLIINEFATNSLKYAFGSAGGAISLRIERLEDSRIQAVIADDGRGLPANPTTGIPGSGTGMKLIGGLARQLQAEAIWSSVKGTQLKLVFADPAKRGRS
ncbi:GAF domain-containing protein [Aurantimonas aggregata]|uniref:histidine kinase n=1 Tax=Aurantimonas aggregata TaxID=2047720 RepID=A0A6L9MN77_9HYPH|nr:histidine kinase dimerization/phosphoacceptor domain -containing protein [Aurantimonas aggregata]NDV89221.1 GAF domain-containing protein [Aurantimonas aggregata]